MRLEIYSDKFPERTVMQLHVRLTNGFLRDIIKRIKSPILCTPEVVPESYKGRTETEKTMNNIDDINLSKDCKKYDFEELGKLNEELRENIIDYVSKKGGHLASNLGVVELTVALHRVFDFPEDKIIFDVGHQSYAHKIMTGRKSGFKDLRSLGGVCGFQLRSESEYDFFGGGHSGTSVAAAIAFAEADKLNSGHNYAVAVVGDGSFTNGMIYEALNNISSEDLRLIIIINDNEMSISENVGAISRYFGRLRTSVKYYRLKRKVKKGLTKIKPIDKAIAYVTRNVKNAVKRLLIKPNFFESFGIGYMGPVDGHDQKKLEAILREAKLLEHPVIVHVCTKKGKGYHFAEEHPEIYHSVNGFDIKTGIQAGEVSSETEYSGFSECFGKTVCKLAEKDDRIIAVTAAMCDGTGLGEFRKKYPDRFFDVGIAEEYAVTFSAGLAASGKKPYLALYSTFLQRGFDQIIHDVALQGLGAVIAVDRAGLVGGDGATHQGIFDCAFLMTVPGVKVYTPQLYSDLEKNLSDAANENCPVFIRYGKGAEIPVSSPVSIEYEQFRVYRFGESNPDKCCVISYGNTVGECCAAGERLSNEGVSVTVVSLKRVKPLDIKLLYDQIRNMDFLLFAEEQIKSGGVSEHIIADMADAGYLIPKFNITAIDGEFPPHATITELKIKYHLDVDGICASLRKGLAGL